MGSDGWMVKKIRSQKYHTTKEATSGFEVVVVFLAGCEAQSIIIVCSV